VLLSLLPEFVDYTQIGFEKSKNLSANQASAPLMQFTPTLESCWVLGAFGILQGGCFEFLELVHQHQIE